MKNKKLRDMSPSNRTFYIFNSVFWTLVMFIVIYPLYLVVISSVSDPDAVALGKVLLWPVDFSLIGYKSIMGYRDMWVSYGNSLFYTCAHIILGIIVTMSGAYATSRKNFPGKKLISGYLLLTMFINGGLIPSFLTVRDLGLYNTRAILIILGCVSVWNLMVARTYIQTSIPDDMYEAAVLDGATHFQYFFNIILPLSKTIMGVLAVYYGVGAWNNYFNGLVYIKDRWKLPLQTILREILASLRIDTTSPEFLEALGNDKGELEAIMRLAEMSRYCIIVVSTAPVIFLYFFMQKYFEKGVMIGSLKG